MVNGNVFILEETKPECNIWEDVEDGRVSAGQALFGERLNELTCRTQLYDAFMLHPGLQASTENILETK